MKLSAGRLAAGRSLAGRFVAVGTAVVALSIGVTAAVASTPHKASAPHDKAPVQQAMKKSPRPPAKAELTYVPINPCRILDTRHGGGKISAGHSRAFYVTGSSGFSGQGGKSASGCGIPSYAKAISTAFTALDETGGGHMTAYPNGSSEPNANAISFPKSQTITSNPTLKLGTSEPSLRVGNHGHSAHVIVDVNGYYVEQVEGMIAADGSIYSGSSGIVSATVLGAGYYKVTLDRDVRYCSPMVDTYAGKGVYGSAYGFDGTSIYVSTWYINSSTHLEVPNSYYFYLSVHC